MKAAIQASGRNIGLPPRAKVSGEKPDGFGLFGDVDDLMLHQQFDKNRQHRDGNVQLHFAGLGSHSYTGFIGAVRFVNGIRTYRTIVQPIWFGFGISPQGREGPNVFPDGHPCDLCYQPLLQLIPETGFINIKGKALLDGHPIQQKSPMLKMDNGVLVRF